MSATEDDLRILRYKDLRILGYGSPVTIWRNVRAGKFPEPFTVNERPAWTPAMLRELQGNKGRAA